MAKVQRVHDERGATTGQSSRQQLTQKDVPVVPLVDETVQVRLVEVVESKVQRLAGEVPGQVCAVSSPEAEKSLKLRLRLNSRKERQGLS